MEKEERREGRYKTVNGKKEDVRKEEGKMELKEVRKTEICVERDGRKVTRTKEWKG